MLYTTGITVVSCLIPLAGLVIGLYFLSLGKRRMDQAPDPRRVSGEKLMRIARRALLVAGVCLILTLVITLLASGLTHKGRVVTAILLVSVQYIAAMVLVLTISKTIKK